MEWILGIQSVIVIGGIGYLIYTYEKRIDTLLKYIKPDTYIKTKGIDEVKKIIQEMIFETKREQRVKNDFNKEINMVNKLIN